jgi:hypothetical protein
MIYTCYEMIQDCRAGKPAGWSFFMANYKPAVDRLAAHYGLTDIDGSLARVRDTLLQTVPPMPERHFVAELRQKLLAFLPDRPIDLDLETLAQAFAPLTVVEKKAVWMETMGYSAEDTARMLRMDSNTVGKVRDKAADLLRGSKDRWSRTILEDHGLSLGRAAAAQSTPDCVSPKLVLDIIDGRSTWSQREQAERHITACWHCIDHFCRLHEVCDLLRAK